MKKLFLACLIALSVTACARREITLPPPIPDEVIVQVAPAQPKPTLTLESLDARVTDIESRMAKARAYRAKHKKAN